MRLILLALLLTTSAHAQWTLLDSHSTADFRGVSSVGKGIVWVSGTNGTVLRSEDAGYLWQHCTTPPGAEKLDFRGIQAFDANTAIVMSSGPGDLSRLYKTTDGCQTWKLVFTNPDKDGFFDALKFVYDRAESLSGYVLGDPVNGKFVIFETVDAGIKWHRVKDAPAASNVSAFAASNSSLALWGLEPGLIATGGATAPIFKMKLHRLSPDSFEMIWTPVSSQLANGSDASGVFAIEPAMKYDGSVILRGVKNPKAQFAVAVGGNYKLPDSSTGTASFTRNDGITWTASTTPPHGYRSAVAYDASTKTWITVGPNGTDISTDDGRNWRALKPGANDAPDADQHWNALSLPFVIGPHGRIGVLNPAALKSNP